MKSNLLSAHRLCSGFAAACSRTDFVRISESPMRLQICSMHTGCALVSPQLEFGIASVSEESDLEFN